MIWCHSHIVNYFQHIQLCFVYNNAYNLSIILANDNSLLLIYFGIELIVTHAHPGPSISVHTHPMNDTLFEGRETTLVCYVNISAAVGTLINVTTSWSGPNGYITSGSDYTLSPTTQQTSNTYEGRLVISELLLDRDNGSTYNCTATLLFTSSSDPMHLLSSNGSDGYIININGNALYLICIIMFTASYSSEGSSISTGVVSSW